MARHRRSRREKTWASFATGKLEAASSSLAQGETEVVAVALPADIHSNPLENTARTLLRLRGRVAMRATGGTDNDVSVAVGLIVDNRNAGPAAGSIMGPMGSPDADWLWTGYGVAQSTSQQAKREDVDQGVGGAEIDSKAMRKLTAAQSLFLVLEVRNLSSTAQVVTGTAVPEGRALYAE